MSYLSCNALVSDFLRVLVRLVPLLLLSAVQVQAAPYSFCVGLSDSSGQGDAGASVFNCSTGAMDESLESTTFGTYTGTARASSTAFDTVNLFASAQFTDYQPNSYVPDSSGGINFAASASANYTDQVAITGPASSAVIELSFSVTGSLFQEGVAAQLCYGFAYGGPILGGSCGVGLPPVITVQSEAFVPDGTLQPLNFQFMAVVFNSDAGMPDLYSALGTADLEHTITMQNLLVTTPGGVPIVGITLSSLGGFDYPLSPLNGIPPIPEPKSAALMLAALALLGFVQRRRRRAV